MARDLGPVFRYFRRIEPRFRRGNPTLTPWGKYYDYDRFLDTLLQLGRKRYQYVLLDVEEGETAIVDEWKRALWLQHRDRYDESTMVPLPCEGLPIADCILAFYLCRHMFRHPQRYTEGHAEHEENLYPLPPQTRFVGNHSVEDYHRALVVWHKYARTRMARVKYRFAIPDSYWNPPTRTLRFVELPGPVVDEAAFEEMSMGEDEWEGE